MPLHEDHRLNTGNLEALATAWVLTLNEVIPAQHIVLGLGKSRPIAFVRVAGKLLLFCSHQPANLVSLSLMTKQARESSRLQCLIFIKKFALIHSLLILA